MKDKVLTIEQMQRLISLGIDTSKASIYWVKQINGVRLNEIIDGKPFLSLSKTQMCCGFTQFINVPTFTLQDIINLLPDEVKVGKSSYDLAIQSKTVTYFKNNDMFLFANMLHYEYDDNILIAAYNMLVWLTENSYLQNKNI